ncbi:MAG: hypothetical protein KatS3mg008_1818 [Acidimicrobiales bacterium]|nr:MAG: hypothetical protein KatS3mg008_1818 [Acidimicrobiales bacterium]
MSLSHRLSQVLKPRKSWLAAVAVFDVLVVAWVLSGAQSSGGSGVRVVDDPESLRAEEPASVTTVDGSGSSQMPFPGFGRPTRQQESRTGTSSRPGGAGALTGAGSAGAPSSSPDGGATDGGTRTENPSAEPTETPPTSPSRPREEPEFYLPDPPLDGDFCDLYAWWTSVRIPGEPEYISRWADVVTEVLPVVLEVAPVEIRPEVATLEDTITSAIEKLSAKGYDPGAIDIEQAFDTIEVRLAAGRIQAWSEDNC